MLIRYRPISEEIWTLQTQTRVKYSWRKKYNKFRECGTTSKPLGEMETNSACDHTRRLGSRVDWTSHSMDLPGQSAISLLSEVSCWPVTQMLSFWCHDVIFMLQAFVWQPPLWKKINRAHRGGLTCGNPVSAVMGWIISHFCLHFLPLGLQASEHAVIIHLRVLFCVLCYFKVENI